MLDTITINEFSFEALVPGRLSDGSTSQFFAANNSYYDAQLPHSCFNSSLAVKLLIMLRLHDIWNVSHQIIDCKQHCVIRLIKWRGRKGNYQLTPLILETKGLSQMCYKYIHVFFCFPDFQSALPSSWIFTLKQKRHTQIALNSDNANSHKPVGTSLLSLKCPFSS